MANLGKFKLGWATSQVDYYRKLVLPTVGKFKLKSQKVILQKDLINSLAKYFSFPKHEVTRLVNCLFHEILSNIRDGYCVKIPYFGTFQPYVYTGKNIFNIGLNQFNSTPRIVQRVQPMLLPSKYSLHVCSPRAAFNTPMLYRLKTDKSNTLSEAETWYKDQARFHRRTLMVYDNPFKLTGFDEDDYLLKESIATSFPSDTEKEELAKFESYLKEKSYLRDKKVIRRFMFRDIQNNKYHWMYHNFLPGKYYVGSDNNFFMSEEETNKNLTRYEVMDSRIKKNYRKFTSTKHLPKKAPKDLPTSVLEEYELGDVHDEHTT